MLNFHDLGGSAVFALVGMIVIIVESGYSLVARNRQKVQGEHTLLFDKSKLLHLTRLILVGVVGVIVLSFLPDILVEHERNAHSFVREAVPIVTIIMEAIWLCSLLHTRSVPDRIYGTPDGLLILRRGMADTIPYANIGRAELTGGDTYITLHFRKPGKFGSTIRFPIEDNRPEEPAFFGALADCMRRADYLQEHHPSRKHSGATQRPSQRVSPGTAQEVTSTAYLLIGIIGFVVLFFVFSDEPFVKFLLGKEADGQEARQAQNGVNSGRHSAGKENAASGHAVLEESESRESVDAFFASAEALHATLWIGAPFERADFEQRIAAQNGNVAHYDNLQQVSEAIQAMRGKRYAVQVAVVPKPNDVEDFAYFTWFLHRDRHVLYGLGVKDGKISSKRIHENRAWRNLP